MACCAVRRWSESLFRSLRIKSFASELTTSQYLKMTAVLEKFMYVGTTLVEAVGRICSLLLLCA